MRIGRLALTQGASGFSKDIPPFLIAAEINYVFGVNVIGLRRAGFSGRDRDEIKAAFKLLYTSGLNISQSLEKAATMELGAPAREFFAFVAAAGKRWEFARSNAAPRWKNCRAGVPPATCTIGNRSGCSTISDSTRAAPASGRFFLFQRGRSSSDPGHRQCTRRYRGFRARLALYIVR